MSLLNRQNFIVWGTTPPEPEHLFNLPEGGPIGRMTASVLLVPGETTILYLNAPAGVNSGHNEVHLVHAKKLTSVANNIGTMEAVAIATNVFQWKIALTAPANLQLGYYRLAFSHETPSQFWYSNRVWYCPDGYEDLSAIFSFRNQHSLGTLPYALPAMSAFRQLIRLKCVTEVPQPNTEIEEYQEVTTGEFRTVQIKQDLSVGFKTLDTDAIGHEGWQTLLMHKDLVVNGVPYSLKTGYNSGSDSRKMSVGSFELRLTSYSAINRC